MQKTVTVATWNMKSIAPKLWGTNGSEDSWLWADKNLNADIYVFTEAKIPMNGIPAGWQAIYLEGGIGARRPWGTIIASKSMELRRVEFENNILEESDFEAPHPASTLTVTAILNGKPWATICGTYGLMLNSKNGVDEFERILWKLIDVLAGSEIPVIVAGDLNLHPDDVCSVFSDIEMIDVLAIKGGYQPRIDGLNGTRVWTHRNTDNPGAAVQELDYIFVTEELKSELIDVRAGIESFPTAFDVSDHAPVTATFELKLP